jgi:hypothetical protein
VDSSSGGGMEDGLVATGRLVLGAIGCLLGIIDAFSVA